ncbi:DUF1489 family protein [Consotaella salsifontis]|uniref:Lysophospholipase n=1 Tax=Consotaella salsifontis TaxID=1365950 RepID=A0A1T4SZY1_9HYPH|nr:DUF1489 domain-containing protein [Consotaella salsifontis]SKA33498.1 hypothetical protein SAMN05428963_11631 [Consotaella salsifontis]
MALHLIKLCVGVESVEDLKSWLDERRRQVEDQGATFEQHHQTRMFPKRAPEILDGGSLYWVIKGQVQVRQAILKLRPVVDAQGIERCHIVLHPELVPTRWQPRRAFQGWRYLTSEDAPPDLDPGEADVMALPVTLRRQLADLGLL